MSPGGMLKGSDKKAPGQMEEPALREASLKLSLAMSASAYYQPGPSWPHPVSKPSIDCLVPALTDPLPNR